ncbi:MAG: tetratricopeptide repeat protein, partial [Pyrinomonadaceae bacterium]|nr:tetratricopeptide repeat protein [Pyrinomonadaceae bacterium]
LALKEIEMLCVLTENSGEVVTKNDLLERVWKDSFVEESNLSRHIYVLRKTFKDFGESDDLIQTVPRRGYYFAGAVREIQNAELVIEKHTQRRTVIEIEEEGETRRRGDAERKTLVHQVFSFFPFSFSPLLLVSLIIALLGAGWFYRANNNSSKAANTPKTLAILPFQSLNKADDENAFGRGITESLITRLGNLRSIVVRQTNSVKHSSESPENPIEIGRKLNADAVLTGTFQRADGRIRISVRLLNTADGSQIWAENFDETETDIFKLQDSLSFQLAESLTDKISPQERQLLAKHYTENQEAFQAYLRGRYFFDKRSNEDYKKAVTEFERAIELDPNYALAYTGLADVYAFQSNGNSSNRQEFDTRYEKARAMATKALELDETLAEAHTTLGWIKRIHDWDWEGSEKHFKRALELNPNYVNARQWYALLLSALGRHDEALIEIEKARKLAPLTKIVLSNYAAILINRRDFDEALKMTGELMKIDDDKSNNHRLLTIVYLNMGNDGKVIEIVEKYIAETDNQTVGNYINSNLAVAYHRTGNTAKANEMLKLLEQKAQTDSGTAFRVAMAYSNLGRKDEAFALLRKCFEERDDRMVWLKVEPRFDNLRDDERFKEILRKMNFAE